MANAKKKKAAKVTTRVVESGDTVVPKKQKLGKYKIYATYATVKKLPKDAINSTVKSVINEAEGLIK